MLCWTPECRLCDFSELLAMSQRGRLQGGMALMEVTTALREGPTASYQPQYPSLLSFRLRGSCPRTPVASPKAFVSFTSCQP